MVSQIVFTANLKSVQQSIQCLGLFISLLFTSEGRAVSLSLSLTPQCQSHELRQTSTLQRCLFSQDSRHLRGLRFLELAYLLNMIHQITSIDIFHYEKETILKKYHRPIYLIFIDPSHTLGKQLTLHEQYQRFKFTVIFIDTGIDVFDLDHNVILVYSDRKHENLSIYSYKYTKFLTPQWLIVG